jgi:hypothetical protein
MQLDKPDITEHTRDMHGKLLVCNHMLRACMQQLELQASPLQDGIRMRRASGALDLSEAGKFTARAQHSSAPPSDHWNASACSNVCLT